MKKFEFSLSHMLNYKNRILDEEQGVLQRLKSERDQIERQINSLTREFEKISYEMRQAQKKGTTVMEMQGFSLQLDSARTKLKDLRLAFQKADKEVEEQTAAVVAANQEVSKLDKLQDRQYEAYRHKMEKADEQRMEEIVSLKLSRQDAG